MDKQLKTFLRENDLLPVMADPEAQEYYRSLGLDPAKIECHFNPRAYHSKEYINLFGNIRRNAIRLHHMDLEGRSQCDNYRHIEAEIKWDSVELQAVEYRDNLDKYLNEIAQRAPMTGVCGVNRDTLSPVSSDPFAHISFIDGIREAVLDGGNPNKIPVSGLPVFVDNSGVDIY